jgi:glucose-6-phosphate isomerase
MEIRFALKNGEKNFENSLELLAQNNFVERIWEKDFTLWASSPDEIINRLGWLDIQERMLAHISEIEQFTNEVAKSGLTNIIVLGMGGSSLAPEVFAKIFSHDNCKFNLKVLDSTHPAMVKRFAEEFPPSKTLYIVSTKSGGTVETLSLMKYFYTLTVQETGKENAGKHFAAITDPGSKLEKTASELQFRKTFLNDPNIGGRFSALSFFGLVPAAFACVDLNELLRRAINESSARNLTTKENNGLALGAAIASLAASNKDKLSFLTSETLSPFGAWIEQLIAESTGKAGKGILPIVGENERIVAEYSNDRMAVLLRLHNEKLSSEIDKALAKKNIPIIEIILKDIYDLGAAFYTWEFGTAVIGHLIGIHPFNQPNVESTKAATRKMVAQYLESGKIAKPEASYEDENLIAISDEMSKSNSLGFVIRDFFGNRWEKVNPYLAIHCYTPYDKKLEEKISESRTLLAKKFGLTSTFGYGPRFLHSTGQLHKGGAGNGFFAQLIFLGEDDIPIPDTAGGNESSLTFGTLINAQSLGDREALLAAGRSVIRIEIKKNFYESLDEILETLHSIQF